VIPVPRELLWDYAEAPEDLIWRLQRIADFSPGYGIDRQTVQRLRAHCDDLKLDAAMSARTEEYHSAWQARP
jgi:hypothetical protein